ncbi:IMPACT family protein [Chondrinema litorale]|uniref:IMPACT family protein n=1 Tax=Chondrinema litorale TaxID=2994555 RepID=UPI002542B42A|nr:YigZ family protein [Chondrinema litorale]UZR93379.1 YigZ family protein [Chondrinema litorale]
MEEDAYLTIAGTSEGFYKEKGSKFLAFAYPVKSEEDVKEHIHDLKKQYYDARHHCYAFIIGSDGASYRAGDDGEPANSAGNPILGQIRSNELTNVLIVVVRYFGGTKLGVSGLINAYKTAAADALENAEFQKEFLTKKVKLLFQYAQMNDAMKIVKDFDLNVIEQDFAMDCKLTLEIREGIYNQFETKVNDIYGLSLKVD